MHVHCTITASAGSESMQLNFTCYLDCFVYCQQKGKKEKQLMHENRFDCPVRDSSRKGSDCTV